MRRRNFVLGLLAVAVIAAATWFASGHGWRTGPSDAEHVSNPPPQRERPAVAAAVPALQKTVLPSFTPPASAPNLPAGDMSPAELSPEQMDAMGAAWADVDMEEVRKAIPDNLYWKLSAPTKDATVLEERDAERERWNVEYGKILSGTGTEDEIRAYYDLRARLSGDYIEFATYLVDHYGSTLSERDVGLLKLAIRLHRARLEEIPRKIEEAFERKRAQDAAREAWLADQATFGDANSDSVPADDSNSE